MAETGIEWASHSLNFYTWDCTKVSPGCQNCYMMDMARHYGKSLTGHPQWRGENTFKELKRIKSGAVVFVNSMSDTYHENVPVQWIHSIHNTALSRPDVTFLVLTKRPGRALALSPYLAWPENLWIGTSVESEEYLTRFDYLLKIPAAGHFTSIEPLLGWIGYKFAEYINPQKAHTPHLLKWVIVGGESGPNRRPFNKAWAAEIRDICLDYNIPFMFKQGSSLRPGSDRKLDGVEWNQSPFELKKHQGKSEPRVTALLPTQLELPF